MMAMMMMILEII